MTSPLRIALAQADFTAGAPAANARRMLQLASEARAAGAGLVVFPELALCGPEPAGLTADADFLAACAAALRELAAGLDGIAAVVGHPARQGGGIASAVSLLQGGATGPSAFGAALAGAPAAAAPARFTLAGLRVALLPHSGLAAVAPGMDDVDLVLVPAAAAFIDGGAARRRARLAALAGRAPLLWLNGVGGQGETVLDGASLLLQGGAARQAPAFIDALLLAEHAGGAWRAIDWPPATPAARLPRLWAALTRALRDHVGKNGLRRVWLGLSGGIDSALVLALAVDALGAEAVTAVAMPSRYSARLSLDLATEQARALGVHLETLPITAPYQGFLEALAPQLAGRDMDVTEENLQARCRGTLLMALSNRHGGLVLVTSNKSEMAVGYGTLYGDMAGGYAPLRDVYKSDVFRLARWRNEQAAARGEPAAVPPGVIARPPTAELHPGQRDSDSLPPYAVLDDILERHLERGESAAEISAAGGHAPDLVARVLRLLRGSAFKRAVAAPGPRLGTCPLAARPLPPTSAWR